MTQTHHIATECGDSADKIGAFLRECEQFCDEEGIAMTYLSNLALSQTYALQNLAKQNERIDDKMARVRQKMTEIRDQRASKKRARMQAASR